MLGFRSKYGQRRAETPKSDNMLMLIGVAIIFLVMVYGCKCFMSNTSMLEFLVGCLAQYALLIIILLAMVVIFIVVIFSGGGW